MCDWEQKTLISLKLTKCVSFLYGCDWEICHRLFPVRLSAFQFQFGAIGVRRKLIRGPKRCFNSSMVRWCARTPRQRSAAFAVAIQYGYDWVRRVGYIASLRTFHSSCAIGSAISTASLRHLRVHFSMVRLGSFMQVWCTKTNTRFNSVCRLEVPLFTSAFKFFVSFQYGAIGDCFEISPGFQGRSIQYGAFGAHIADLDQNHNSFNPVWCEWSNL